MLMPTTIAKKHSLYIQMFVDSGSIQSIAKTQQFTLALNKLNFLVPVLKRIKLNYTIEDFGVTVFIETIKESSDFLLGDTQGNVIGTTQKIFKICFA